MPAKKSFRNTVFDESKDVVSEMLGNTAKTPEPTPAPARPNAHAAPPVGNVRRWEKKSRNVQLLLTPSLHERVKAASDASGSRSFNEYVNMILEKTHPTGQ